MMLSTDRQTDSDAATNYNDNDDDDDDDELEVGLLVCRGTNRVRPMN